MFLSAVNFRGQLHVLRDASLVIKIIATKTYGFLLTDIFFMRQKDSDYADALMK